MSLQYKTDKQLQDRIHDELARLVALPGNNVCADCGAITPKWSSTNLGVFICIRCAGIHRSIGTHVTKVKSITLDSWTEEQFNVMKKVGNVNASKVWEANNHTVMKSPSMDQRQLERYIRDKYERKRFFSQAAYDAIYNGKGALPQQPVQSAQIQQPVQKQANAFDMLGDDSIQPMQMPAQPVQRSQPAPQQANLFDMLDGTSQPAPQPKQQSMDLFSIPSQPAPQPKQQSSVDIFSTMAPAPVNQQATKSYDMSNTKVDYMQFYQQPRQQQQFGYQQMYQQPQQPMVGQNIYQQFYQQPMYQQQQQYRYQQQQYGMQQQYGQQQQPQSKYDLLR